MMTYQRSSKVWRGEPRARRAGQLERRRLLATYFRTRLCNVLLQPSFSSFSPTVTRSILLLLIFAISNSFTPGGRGRNR